MAGVLGWIIEDPVQRQQLLQQLISYIRADREPALGLTRHHRCATLRANHRGHRRPDLGRPVASTWRWTRSCAVLFAGAAPRDFIQNRLRGIVMVVVLIALMVGTLVITSLVGIVTGITGQDQLIRIITPLAGLVVLIHRRAGDIPPDPGGAAQRPSSATGGDPGRTGNRPFDAALWTPHAVAGRRACWRSGSSPLSSPR
jgi:hypothetical protein